MEPFRLVDNEEQAAGIQNSVGMAMFVLQFPGEPELSVMVVHDGFRMGFLETFGAFIISEPAEQVQSIPESMLNEYEPQQDDTCAICLGDAYTIDVTNVDDGTVSYVPHSPEPPWVSLFHCKHRFHRHCVLKCKSVNCPMCRTSHAV